MKTTRGFLLFFLAKFKRGNKKMNVKNLGFSAKRKCEIASSSSQDSDHLSTSQSVQQDEAISISDHPNDDDAAIRKMYTEFMNIFSSHTMSKAAAKDVWSFFHKNCDSAARLKGKERLHGSFDSVERFCNKESLQCLMNISLQNRKTQEKVFLENVSQFPAQYRSRDEWDHLYTITFFRLMDIYQYHSSLHGDCETFDMNNDGIPEDRSSGRSLDVLAIRFKNCKTVYPYRIFKQGTVTKLSVEDFLTPVIEEINQSPLRLHLLICDAPKRAYLRKLKCHSGFNSCEYCVIPGIYVSSVVFPTRQSPAALRTDSKFREIGLNVQMNPKLPDDYCCGIKGASPLFNLDNFDMVHHIPIEYMHNICLGVCRKLMKHFFGESSQRNKRNTAKVKAINSQLLNVKTPSEFSRRPRELDISNYKASEFKYIMLAYYPIFWSVLTEEENQLFSVLCFLIRALTLPDKYYSIIITKYNVEEMAMMFCRQYEVMFSEGSMSYNMHAIQHLPLVRNLGPLTDTSTFCFEDYFSELKRSFSPGTPSIGKQILNSFFFRRCQEKSHKCKKKILYNPSSSSSSDSIIYSNGSFFSIRTPIESGKGFMCKRLKTDILMCPNSNLNFSDVLSYKLIGEYPQDELVRVDQIEGKGIVVMGIISFLSENVLVE